MAHHTVPDCASKRGSGVKAFKKGADGCGELAKILPAIRNELWKRGYSNEDLQRIFGGNKMRVYREVWEGIAPEDEQMDPQKRRGTIDELRRKFQSR